MKNFFLFILFVLLICFIYFYINQESIPKEKTEILTKIGYNTNEINLIKSKLSINDINYLETNKKIDNIDKFLLDNNFNHNYFNNYLTYYQKNKNANINDIITIVNNKIDDIYENYDPIIIDLLNEEYFLKDNLVRYIDYSTENSNLKEVITHVNCNIDYQYYTNITPVDITKDKLMLVNKYYKLSENYEPEDLVTINSKYGYTGKLRKEAYEQYIKMYNDAFKENLKINVVSPYRSYSTQQNIYNNYVKQDGILKADSYSARPGHSEHQLGLAVDIGFIDDTFDQTREFVWLKTNAYKYGFILRYPKDKEHLTGYDYEPWHYRYLGIEMARKVYESGLTYEEYYAYYLK